MQTFIKNADVLEKLLHKNDPLEKTIEKKYCDIAKKHGWIPYKFSSPNNRGVPDRIFIRDGVIFWIEFKRKNKKPTPKQNEVHKKMRKAGCVIHVIDRIDICLAELLFL